MRIALNKCYGGFALSDQAKELLMGKGWLEDDYWECIVGNVHLRTSSELMDVLDELGSDAVGHFSVIQIVEFTPPSGKWVIGDYDGLENITIPVETGVIKTLAREEL